MKRYNNKDSNIINQISSIRGKTAFDKFIQLQNIVGDYIRYNTDGIEYINYDFDGYEIESLMKNEHNLATNYAIENSNESISLYVEELVVTNEGVMLPNYIVDEITETTLEMIYNDYVDYLITFFNR